MREYRFGRYMETVPVMDSSPHPSIPEPTSSARAFSDYTIHPPPGDRSPMPLRSASFGYEYLPKSSLKWQKFSGQKLRGDMIPRTELDVTTDPKQKCA